MWRRLVKRLYVCGLFCALLNVSRGAGAAVYLDPNNDASRGWEYPGPDAAHYVLVDERDGSGSRDNVWDSASPSTDVYDLENLGSGHAGPPGAIGYARCDGTITDGELTLRLRKGTTWLAGKNVTVPCDETWHYFSVGWSTGSWTESEVDGALISVAGYAGAHYGNVIKLDEVSFRLGC
jgi:ribosomal protein L27